MHDKYVEQMNGRAGKIQERLFYSEAMLCHRKHARKLSGDLRHQTTGIRRTQENLKIAQIAKDGALNALLNASEDERGRLMQAYKEADQRDREAHIQIMMSDLKKESESDKFMSMRKISEAKDVQILELLNKLQKQTQLSQEMQKLLSKVDPDSLAKNESGPDEK